MKEIQVEVHGPFQTLDELKFVISLNEPGSNRGCLLWVGEYEAKSIILTRDNIRLPRPMVYDLLKNMLEGLDVKVEKVVVTGFIEESYRSTIHTVDPNRNKREIDSRPSDAINLALRIKCPVFINEDLLVEGHVLKNPDILKQPMISSDEAIAEWLKNLDPNKIPRE